jgi:NosR/NirI family nitrous oxide reductase transcriptional regulator
MDHARAALRALVCCWTLFPAFAAAAETLAARATPDVLAVAFPGAESLGPEEGAPPAAAVYVGGAVAGYVFSTLDILAAPGYSSVPFDVIAGVSLDGRVTGAKVVFHREPYIMGDEKRQGLLDTYLQRHEGALAIGANARLLPPDFVAGATVSARAMRAAIFDAARLVLRARVARPDIKAPTLDTQGFRILSWEQLVERGLVATRRFKARDVADAFASAGAAGAAPQVAPGGADDAYIDIAAAPFTPAMIGRNLLGPRPYEDYLQSLGRNGFILVVASRGAYDFVGTEHNKAATGHVFDRLRLVQEGRVAAFSNADYQRLGTGGSSGGVRAYDQAALFSIPRGFDFDPLKPWRIETLVHAKDGAATAVLPLDYSAPPDIVLLPPPPPVPAWVEAWRDGFWREAVLAAALVVLTLILAFQARLSRNRLAHRLTRDGFLLFTLIWLGWIVGAQLSIVNVANYLMAPFRKYDIGFYLAEPLIAMIAAYALVSVLVLGRGVFCGWLCPFGALQELLARCARFLGLPQWNPGPRAQSRMWMVKYASAALVLGAALLSLDFAPAAAEIEPFKTAITSRFTRAWPFAVYAGALLFVGLFTERAFCRFLCPLGGFLAALDRLHVLDMLKRRPECGSPCHLCERSCPVKAIEPTGRIVMAECFQCLDCQVEYHDDARGPPLARARKLSAAAAA